MLNAARLYFFVFAALTAAGGLMGFIKTTPGLVTGLVVSLLLLGRFLPAYLKKGAAMPAIPMIILSAIGIIFAIVALVKR
jgi:uncharacterized membrane protein (UPF0136 family)